MSCTDDVEADVDHVLLSIADSPCLRLSAARKKNFLIRDHHSHVFFSRKQG